MSDKTVGRRYGPSAFGELDDNPTVADVTDSIFGKSKTSRHLRAKPIDITKIRPDPLQPRRAVPSELRQSWGGDPNRVQELFDIWTSKIREERGDNREFKWKGILEGTDSSRGKEAEKLKGDDSAEDALSDLSEPFVGPLEASFLRLVDLAASIKRDQLTNPITIAPIANSKNQFEIETGERRWLAYHLLSMVYGADDWGEIPARQVGEVSVWRQASENNARDDLNAISKARQLALLLMALHHELKDVNFEPPENFDHEREFYAQVADGNKFRVPRGHGEQLLNAMGLSSASHLRRYRGILRVDSAIWDMADDGDWTEREIRDKWQLQKYQSEKRDQGHGTQVVQTALPSGELLATRKFYQRQVSDVAKVAHKAVVGEVSNEKRMETLTKINALRDWLNEQEKLISGK